MENIQDLQESLDQFTTKANAAINETKSEVKALSDEYKSLSASFAELAQKGDMGYMSAPGGMNTKAISRLFDQSTELKAFRERKQKSAIITGETSLDVLIKATVVGDAGTSSTDYTYPVQAARYGQIANDARTQLSLLSSLPRIGVSAASFEYVALDAAYSDAADYQVNQGDTKAVGNLPTELKTANIATIAVTLPCSEQVLADSPALMTFIQSRLNYSVLLKLQNELVAGAGTTGKIGGLLTLGTAFTQSSNAGDADAIGEAQAQLQTIGWNANLVLLHPTKWQALRAERLTAGDYVAGGWANPAPPSIWGVPVLLSAAVPTNKAIVMDTTQCLLLDRQSVAFEFGRINANFVENILQARSELRAGLAVLSPSAVQVVTI
ncbi:MAG: phage major capsid protein [Methylotenera sp.]